MNLLNDFVENFTSDLNAEKLNGTVEQEKNPILLTLLGSSSTISNEDLDKIIRRNIGYENLPASIRKLIEEIKEKNEKLTEIKDYFKKFDPKFNRIYVFENGRAYLDENEEPDWDKIKKKKFDVIENKFNGHSYYSPKGWRRYSLKIDDFDQKYKDWPIAYHGTKSNNLINILAEGFRVSKGRACFGNGVYFSPSIEYCGHWRYGTPKRSKTTGFYIQAVFQCKLRPDSFTVHRETLLRDPKKIIDPNFKNEQLEWLISPDTIDQLNKEGKEAYIIYGMMVRITKVDPKELQINDWWNYCHKTTYEIF